MSRPSAKAFTLVEIMVAVTVIGLLASLALPAFQLVKLKAEATVVVNDLRQFSSCLERYCLQMGYWPPDTDAQIIPDGLAGEFDEEVWRTPIPGKHIYEWDYDTSGVTAAISLRPNNGNSSDPIFEQIDKILDDGVTTTGNFLINGDRYMLILER